jgi:hypothetical protein
MQIVNIDPRLLRFRFYVSRRTCRISQAGKIIAAYPIMPLPRFKNPARIGEIGGFEFTRSIFYVNSGSGGLL